MLKYTECERVPHSVAAFSLVEVTLALGIAAFCLLGVFGLMPIGIQTNRSAASQTAATNIAAAVIADLRGTPVANGTSLQFCISFGSPTTLYFDSSGRCSTDLAGLTGPCGASWVPALSARYQLNITWTGSSSLRYADLKITWPAAATTVNANGAVEIFAAFDRD